MHSDLSDPLERKEWTSILASARDGVGHHYPSDLGRVSGADGMLEGLLPSLSATSRGAIHIGRRLA